jgi:hypothetical protein
MTPAETQRLKSEYVLLAAYYAQTIDDGALAFYAEDLQDLPLTQVLDAMRRLRRQPGRRQFPLPADIRDSANPQGGSIQAQSNDIAGRISAAIGRFGYTQQETARTYLGELGWLVVCRMGGWRALCTSLTTSEMGTFRAQCRDLCKAQLEMEAAGARRPSTAPALMPARGGPGGGRLLSMSEIGKAIPALVSFRSPASGAK